MESDNPNLKLKAILDDMIAGIITEADARDRMADIGMPGALIDEIIGEIQSGGDVLE